MRGGTQLLSLFILLTQDVVKSIRLLELRVPAHAVVGKEAFLGCQFDMEGDILYSVKWYKDDREFYRYVPKDMVPMKSFNRNGIRVDVSRSSSNVVTLMDLKRESAGLYRCEVSGEAPHFAIAAAENYIHIDVLPQEPPRITGLKPQYLYGDRLEANCTSSGSMPEAQLKWVLNNKTAPRDVRGPWRREWNDPPNTFETSLQLRFRVMPKHFKDGVMELKCQATIAPLYQKETVHTIFKTKLQEPEPEELAPSTEDLKEQMSQMFHEISGTRQELNTISPAGETGNKSFWESILIVGASSLTGAHIYHATCSRTGISVAVIVHTFVLHIFINAIL